MFTGIRPISLQMRFGKSQETLRFSWLAGAFSWNKSSIAYKYAWADLFHAHFCLRVHYKSSIKIFQAIYYIDVIYYIFKLEKKIETYFSITQKLPHKIFVRQSLCQYTPLYYDLFILRCKAASVLMLNFTDAKYPRCTVQ